MNAVGTLWIFFLMVLMTADVAGRNLLNAPIRGVLEITTLSIVSIVYLQLADTLRNGQLTRSDGWLTALRLRRGRLAAVLQGAFHLVGAMFVGLICVASVPLLVESWENGEYLGAIGDFQARLWPMRAVVIVGSACTVLTFLFLAGRDVRTAWRGDSRA